MGSKRLGAVEGELAALHQTIARQGERLREMEAVRAADVARMEALQARLDEARAMLDAAHAATAQLAERLGMIEADAEAKVGHVSDRIATEQSQRVALEQIVSKLDRRLDAQTEEARVTATALLQRIGS